MSMYAIGDIHGEYYKLIKLIKNLKNPEKIIFLGDYINKGLYSMNVLDFLYNLEKSNAFETVFLTGNHEYKLFKYDLDFLNKFGGKNLKYSYLKENTKLDIEDINKIISYMKEKGHYDFLTNTKLYYYDKNYFYFHAGFNPKINNINALKKFDKESILFSRFNFINSRKLFENKKVIFGHTAFNYPYIDNYKIGIDTGGYIKDNAITAFNITDNFFINSNGEIYDFDFARKGGEFIINE